MRGRGGRRGFTLLEMLIVAGVVALIAGLVAVGLSVTSRASEQARAIREMVTVLGAARVQAMAQGRSVEVSVSIGQDGVALSFADRERRWSAPGLRVERPVSGGALTIVYDRAGRTEAREWLISGVDGGGRGAAGNTRIWRVSFDPITGVPGAERVERAAAG